jgi:dihydrofolate reductase
MYLFNMITLDGFFEGPNRDLSWHNVDKEFNDFAIEQLNSTDLLIFGRVTYELMASYWPTKQAVTNDPIVAGKMNNLPKIVFSHTMKKAAWNNTKLVKANALEEMVRLKQQSGKDVAIFGSSILASYFTQHNLIDEYRVIVNPVILGNGRPLFSGIDQKLDLKLLRTQTFKSGNVLLIYKPTR